MKDIKSEQEFTEWADRYLRNELNQEEIKQFEDFCTKQPNYSLLFEKHKDFLKLLEKTENRKDFKKVLSDTAQEYHISRKISISDNIIQIWSRFKLNIAAAAAVAVISVFSTLWLTGFYSTIKKTSSDYSALRRDINNVKRNVNAQNAAINSINRENKESNEVQYGATGFMLSKEGYVVTNNHVISGADSIFLINDNGEAYKASLVYTDVAKDIAILHIEDENFDKQHKPIPYTFKSQETELGEDIYTIGYPRDEAVYGQGYLSSYSGYQGDTIAYQISIPVNPGNSGGPVLDTKGNIIGMISGKQAGQDGAAFAIKTRTLLEVLNEIPQESLQEEILINQRNTLHQLPKTEQIKKLQGYVYLVKVY